MEKAYAYQAQSCMVCYSEKFAFQLYKKIVGQIDIPTKSMLRMWDAA